MDTNSDSQDSDGSATQVIYRIVKCGLHNAMALDDAQYNVFSSLVEQYVNIVSRSMRRASLLLLHHLTYVAEHDLPIPDLYNAGDTYWKDWLRLSWNQDVCTLALKPKRAPKANAALLKVKFDVAHEYLPTQTYHRVRIDVGADGNVKVHLSEVNLVKETTQLALPYVGTVLARNDGSHVSPDTSLPELDQVIAYAGRTFQTTVCNNAWVPLVPRLTRLVKALLKSKPDDTNDIKCYEVMSVLRGGRYCDAGWPAWLANFIIEVRTRLGLREGQRLFDEYGKNIPFATMFKFNYWMQCWLTDNNQKRIALSPVFTVARKFVRLDRKTLMAIATKFFPESSTIVVLKKVLDEEQCQNDHMKKAGETPRGFQNPDLFMIPRPVPVKKKKSCTPKQWVDYTKAKKQRQNDVDRIKQSEEYNKQLEKYRVKRNAESAVISELFSNLPVPTKWSFDGSIQTDGVAIVLQFSQTVKKQKQSKSNAKKPIADDAGAASGDDNYDKHQSTVLKLNGRWTIVLGLDPGRVALATVTYELNEDTMKLIKTDTGKDVKKKRKVWKLTRAQFYSSSGVMEENEKQARRFEELKPVWQELCNGDASLRTPSSRCILSYLQAYSEYMDRWWELALRRVESRSNFRRYIGKRKVLDSFFAKLKRDVNKLFPGFDVELAYGSAGPTMKATGPGECAVPTTECYRACQRVFQERVTLTDEAFSTKVEWESGTLFGKVYKIVNEERTECTLAYKATKSSRLQHTPAWKTAIPLHQKDGFNLTAPTNSRDESQREGEAQAKKTISTLRGMQFSPERCTYRDRDLTASATIARLRVLEMQKKARPAPFCRKTQS